MSDRDGVRWDVCPECGSPDIYDKEQSFVVECAECGDVHEHEERESAKG